MVRLRSLSRVTSSCRNSLSRNSATTGFTRTVTLEIPSLRVEALSFLKIWTDMVNGDFTVPDPLQRGQVMKLVSLSEELNR